MSAESTKEATAEGHKVTSVETPSVPKQEMLERIEGVAGPGVDVQERLATLPDRVKACEDALGLKPGFAPAGAPPAGEVMNRATSHTLQSIAGTWVPTRLDDWRGCPVGKEAFVKTYKYVVQGNGDWVNELYPPHRGHVEPAEESGLYEGYGVEPGRYPAKWRLQPDGVLVMAWGDQYQVVYYLVREGDPRASGPSLDDLTELQEKWDEESRRRARVAKMLPCLCCCDEGQYIYCCLPTAPTYILPLCLHMVLCPQQRCNPQIIDGLCGQPGIRKVYGGETPGPCPSGPTTFKEACKMHCVVNCPFFWVCPCGPCGWCCLQSDNGVTKFGDGWGSPDCIWNPILCWDFKPPCGQSAYQCSVDFPPCCILCIICNDKSRHLRAPCYMQLKSFDPDIGNPGSGCWVPKG